MLIEVMVGAIVLAIATAAVLDGLDGAQATGRANKARSVGAALAQQDVERLRALPIAALIDLDQTRTVDSGGVRYTVKSNTEWMRDNSGELSCVNDTTQASYLKVTSTASSPASAQRPVTETTIITPPAAFSSTAGTATVKTTDRDGNPLAGVTITLSGAASYSGTTNALGCAIFSFITPGNYQASVPGNLVSWNSERPANVDFTVAAGKTTPVQMELGQPASLRIHFKNPSGASVTWTSATVPHANLPGGFKVFTSPSPTTLITATDLFPQKDGYGVYAGSCEANNPANPYWGDPTYFLDHPASHADVTPGAANVDVDAVLPVLSVTAKRSKSRDLYIRVDQLDQPNDEVDCRVTAKPRNKEDNAPTGSGSVTVTKSFALPFGHYRVCVDDGGGSGGRRVSTTTSNDPALIAPATVAVGTLDLTTSSTSGTCSYTFP